MSIEVNSITKLYGEQKALQDVSFTVNPGSITGFLGPNGAGKSTMMKILTCFIPQSSGSAKVCGFDVNEDSLEVRKNVGYLPEHNPLYLDMYVKEYLGFIAGLHHLKNTTKRVAEMIEMTGLQVEQKKKIGALSKGYRQRVGLAQALIHDPKVLILDEPTTGLDPNQLVEIRGLIKTLGKEKTVLFSTHILPEVQAVCDNIIIVNKGLIVANSNAKALQQSDSKLSQLVVEFDQAIDEKLLKAVKGVQQVSKLANNTWRISFNKENDVRQQIMKLALDKNLTLLSLKLEEKSLEQIFQQLTS